MQVVVIHIDALQPAYIGAYGCDWVETPALDALAARGVVFDQHFANDLTGTGGNSPVQPSDRCRVVELNSLRPPWTLTAKDLGNYFSDEPDDGDETVEPWLDPLPPRIDEKDDSTFQRLQCTYAAAIRKMDAKLGTLLKKHRDSMLLVTSGRGLALGEHNEVGFADSLHEELVHLPLLMAWPDDRYSGRRVSALTQPFDLAPTIAGILGEPWSLDDDPVAHGCSLLPLIESPLSIIRSYAVARHGQSIGIRSPAWYYLRDSRDEPRLFAKPDDRWEVNEVHRQHPAVGEEMENALLKYGAAITREAR